MVEVISRTPVDKLNPRTMAEWCHNNCELFLSMLPRIARFPSGPRSLLIEDPRNHISLSSEELCAVIYELNPLIKEVSSLRIEGKPTHYFPVGTKYPSLAYPTPERKNAMSDTAIIPAFTTRTDQDRFVIHLCSIPHKVTKGLTKGQNVQKIMQATALIRELARVGAMHSLYGNGYNNKFWTYFASAAEKYPPISYYSSMFREPGEKITSYEQVIAEFSETVSALLLGFTFCDEKERRFDPLSDRPEVAVIVQDFLNAELLQTVSPISSPDP